MQRVLLIVDDEQEICRTVKRLLRNHFDAVLSAGSVSEAEPLLQQPVSHLVCDLFLGKDEPLGCDLIQTWRRRQPSIRYAALFTGSTYQTSDSPPGVDRVFSKPGGLTDLIETLRQAGATKAV